MAGGSNPPSATISRSLLADAVAQGANALDIPADAVILLGVSGGPDSMALLHGAAEMVGRGANWTLIVAHLDHALRVTSPDDARFVADAAASLGLACEVRRTDVVALAAAQGRSLEDAGRQARYRFFEAAAPTGALIATAHTLDDSVETVLLNLLRGSGPSGVAGIPARRGRIVRPLLSERRDRLRDLLDNGGMAYRIDPTNTDPAFLRNRVRAELVPMLETLRPGAVERIARFGEIASHESELLDGLAAAELERRRGADGMLDWHDPPPMALAARVLRLAIGDPPPSAERIGALLEAAAGDRGGVRIELGGGRIATIRRRRIGFGDADR